MWLLPDAVLVQVDYVRAIFDLGILLFPGIHAEHEREWGISVAKVSQGQVWNVEVSDVLILVVTICDRLRRLATVC